MQKRVWKGCSRARIRRIGLWLLAGAVIVVIVAAGGVYALVASGAAQLDGHVSLVGLSAPVTVVRDNQGVPTISAENAVDAARAIGFVHAQDRFFQMDLLRRSAAGELAALLGPQPGVVAKDLQHRRFRMRAVAKRVLTMLPARQRALVGAYSLGVNDGLTALAVRPYQYILLGQKPSRWRPEDSILVIMALYFDLQDAADTRELKLARMRATLPTKLYQFLTAAGTRWDSPMRGRALPTPAIPGHKVFDMKQYREGHTPSSSVRYASRFVDLQHQRVHNTIPDWPSIAGSNSWALAGARTTTGAALLANDIHLHLQAPPEWYRLRLLFNQRDSSGTPTHATGITLPGVPIIIAGSNGHIAWGVTNTHGDWVDLVKLEQRPGHADQYRTPKGWQHFTEHQETIQVKGAPNVNQTVRGTVWGPVIGTGAKGTLLAVHWVAAQPTAINLGLWKLLETQTAAAAIGVAAEVGFPEMNFVVADTQGHIGWTVLGVIPHRIGGYNPAFPSSWASGERGWQGWLAPEAHPRVLNPDSGIIWTANNRIVGGAALAALGDGGYALGARAQQIYADLKNTQHATPQTMLDVQLDDRARFLSRWQQLVLRLITPHAAGADQRRALFRRAVATWGGHASVDSVGYRLVRLFHQRLRQRVLHTLLAPVRARYQGFSAPVLPQFEGALWALVTKQPVNLLNPDYSSWDALMLSVVDSIIADAADTGSGLAGMTWGQHNTVQIHNRMTTTASWLSRWLDMPSVALPGDRHMPRVQTPNFGASMRMVVAPGHEKDGIFEIPGGQSGNPLSSFYDDEFTAWEQGKPAAFLPGPGRHTLVLQPQN